MVEERKRKIKNQTKKKFKNQCIPAVFSVLFIMMVVSITYASDNRPSKKKKRNPIFKKPSNDAKNS